LFANKVPFDFEPNEMLSVIIFERNVMIKMYIAYDYIPKSNQSHDYISSILKKHSGFFSGNEKHSIASAVLCASLFLMDMCNRPQYFYYMIKIASSNDSLDTVETIFTKFSKSLGYPTINSFHENFILDSLLWWDLDWDEFPFFLFGKDNMGDFIQVYIGEFVCSIIEKGSPVLLNQIKTMYERDFLIDKCFPLVYSRFLISTKKKESNIIFDFFDISSTLVEDYKRKFMVQIIFILLKGMIGLDKTHSDLPTHLGVNLCLIDFEPDRKAENNSIQVNCNIESVLNGKIILLGEKLDLKSIYRLFQLYNNYFYQDGYSENSLNSLRNGYLTLIACITKHLEHPAIYHSVFINLLKCCQTAAGCKLALPLLNYLLLTFNPILVHNLHLYVDKLSCIWNASGSFLGIRDTIVEFLNLLKKYSHDAYVAALFFCDDSLNVGYYPKNYDPITILEILKYYDYRNSAGIVVFEKLNTLINLKAGEFEKSQLKDISNFIETVMGYCNLYEPENLLMKIRKCLAKIKCFIRLKDFSYLVSQQTLQIYKSESAFQFERNATLEIFPLLFSPDFKVADAARELIGIFVDEEKTKELLPYQKEFLTALSFSQSKISTEHYEVTGDYWYSANYSAIDWIRKFIINFLAVSDLQPQFNLFVPLVEAYPQFGFQILPSLFHFVLCNSSTSVLEHISTNCTLLFRSDVEKNHLAIRQLLRCVKFVNMLPISKMETLKLDYFLVSQAALLIGESHLSLYFIELCNNYGQKIAENQKWKHLLECFKGIKDEDGFEGTVAALNTESVNIYDLMRKRKEHNRDWLGLWSLEDSLFYSEHNNETNKLISGVLMSGHYYTLNQLTHLPSIDGSEEQYESLWRLGKWEENPNSNPRRRDNYHEKLFDCLRKFHSDATAKQIRMAAGAALTSLKLEHLNLAVEIPFIEIEEFADFLDPASQDNNHAETWSERIQSLSDIYSFEEIELIIASRNVLFELAPRNSQVNIVDKFASIHFISNIEMCINSCSYSVARKMIMKYRKIFPRPSIEVNAKIELLTLRTEWGLGEKTIALKFFSSLLSASSGIVSSQLYSEMLNRFGCFAVESKFLRPQEIIEKYLEPAANSDECFNPGKAYFDLAHYCDSLLEDLMGDENYLKSVKIMDLRELELETAKKLKQSSKNDPLLRKIEKQVNIEKNQVERTKEEQEMFLSKTVSYYISVLISSDYKNEHALFRFLSLWFSHHSNIELNNIIAEKISTVQSKKFIEIMYQLSARLVANDPDESIFYQTLCELVYRIIYDYPNNSLPYIITLKNVSKEKKANSTISTKSINYLLQRIKKNKSLHQIAYHFDVLFAAYINTAYQEVPETARMKSSKISELDKSSPILKINSDQQLPVLTANLKLPNPQDYTSEITIVKFESNYWIPGGINAPKVIKCLGSDGVEYKQLVKGKGTLDLIQMI
jgi:hypothetical protein